MKQAIMSVFIALILTSVLCQIEAGIVSRLLEPDAMSEDIDSVDATERHARQLKSKVLLSIVRQLVSDNGDKDRTNNRQTRTQKRVYFPWKDWNCQLRSYSGSGSGKCD